MIYRVAECFASINGESSRAGELAYFIRFVGCNLNCSYCDTAWAIPQDAPCVEMTSEEIMDKISESGIKNVTLTGGEPLIQKDINPLIERIASRGFRLELETNGAVAIEETAMLRKEKNLQDKITFTLDYKCPSSGMEEAMVMENYEHLTSWDSVKFVVGNREDLEKAREVIREMNLLDRNIPVYISPVFGSIHPETIVEYMKQYKMNDVHLQLQLHKFIWDPDKRGV